MYLLMEIKKYLRGNLLFHFKTIVITIKCPNLLYKITN